MKLNPCSGHRILRQKPGRLGAGRGQMGQVFAGAAAAAISTGNYQESCLQCVQAGGVAAAAAATAAAAAAAAAGGGGQLYSHPLHICVRSAAVSPSALASSWFSTAAARNRTDG